MSLKQQALRGSLVLTIGEGLVYACSFVRNMILARMLTKADFGIAATFSLVMTLLEMSDKLGMARFVIRDNDGDRQDFIATAHLVHFAVASLSALLIVAAAHPLSITFGLPGQRWAIAALALAPLCRGFEHLDIRRFERHLRFTPSLLVEAVPQVVLTVAAWPIAAWLGDYRAVLLLLLTKAAVTCIGSHVLAEHPYRFCMRTPYVKRMIRFGWPLLINGFLMFGVLQGDQFLVAAWYSVTELAPYAAAASLTMAPTFFFARVFNSLMLPILARVQDDPLGFAHRYRQILSVMTTFAVVCALAMIVGGEALMRTVYGAQYSGAGVILGWLAAANAFRNIRIAPALAAIAKGDSQNQMISSWCRVMALLPAAGLALTHQPVWTIASSGLFGEALACWVSFLRLKRRDSVPLSTNLAPTGCVLISVAGAGALVFLGVHQVRPMFGLILAVLAASAGGAATVTTLPELRAETVRLYVFARQGGIRDCVAALRSTGPAVKNAAS